ncbi:MAG: DUF6431 domain-containing protein [Anaerolineae bacterium]
MSPKRVIIVQGFAGSVKEYIAASREHSSVFSVPEQCPHPDCQAARSLIRWGTYTRMAITGEADYRLPVQRVRCKVCGRTHSLLPDFLHPYRRFVIALLQHVTALYLLVGLGWRRLMHELPEDGPAHSTVREWVDSFAHGAGHLLFDCLLRHLLTLAPGIELSGEPPRHLNRVPEQRKRLRLEKAHTFWLLAEQLYVQVKTRLPHLHFAATQLFPFLVHWLKSQSLPPRLFWSPVLPTTPTRPF